MTTTHSAPNAGHAILARQVAAIKKSKRGATFRLRNTPAVRRFVQDARQFARCHGLTQLKARGAIISAIIEAHPSRIPIGRIVQEAS